MKFEGTYSEFNKMVAGILQTSVLDPILFLFYVDDVPTSDKAKIATIANDTFILEKNLE